jgi:hypothetical protein
MGASACQRRLQQKQETHSRIVVAVIRGLQNRKFVKCLLAPSLQPVSLRLSDRTQLDGESQPNFETQLGPRT